MPTRLRRRLTEPCIVRSPSHAGSTGTGCGSRTCAEAALGLRALGDHCAQRLGVADDDLRSPEIDPAEAAPIGQMLIDDLARDTEEARELGLRDPQLEVSDASRAAVQR